MANGKWITGLLADMPLDEAARRVFAVRLTVVRKHLPRAIREPDKDPEHVHQLRVGTRRAAAALRIFKTALRRKLFKRGRRVLRRLRRAAGAARDWDVFRETLLANLEKAPPSQQPGLQFLLGHVVALRRAAQTRLAETGGRQQESLSSLLAKIKTGVKSAKKRRTLADLARPTLTALVAELDETAQQDLTRYENLHQVRIAGKRLRYALEVFASCFGPELQETYYPQVERLQDILGEANDSHAAGERLEELREQLRKQPAIWRQVRAGIEPLLRYHQRRLPQLRRLFSQWWRQWQKAGGERALEAALTNLGG